MEYPSTDPHFRAMEAAQHIAMTTAGPRPKRSNWVLAIKLDDDLTVSLHADEALCDDVIRDTFGHAVDNLHKHSGRALSDAVEGFYRSAAGEGYVMITVEECEVK